MSRLSLPLDRLQERYEVVVIGSGYGGAISASRMARAGQSVCVLERGRELQPGEYPETLAQASGEVQVDAKEGRLGRRSALYEFVLDRDMSVFKGCGLGGTSLVNANVSLRAEPWVFADSRWPEPLRWKDSENDHAETASPLEEGYRRAEAMLCPNSMPSDQPMPAKTRAHQLSAVAMHAAWKLAPINVTFEDKVNQAGVEQRACTQCGDCVTGCNHWAKNTVLMNYLPDAFNHGAEIFTEVEVKRLQAVGESDATEWLVHFEPIGSGRAAFSAPNLFVRAGTVILGAGALGSTEVLLRSAQAGLSLSSRLGAHFTGNGDILGFGHDLNEPVNGVGAGDRDPTKLEPVGPCITSVIDQRKTSPEDRERGYVLEEGSIPGPLAALVPTSLGGMRHLFGESDRTVEGAARRGASELANLFQGARRGAASRTQTYLVMSHDDAEGHLDLEGDRLEIYWPEVGRQHNALIANDAMERAAKALGGNFIKNPAWSDLLNDRLVTVHPLGGCCMGERAEHGVVNHKGQVFEGSSGTKTYGNLYVNDGAIVPRSLGVNPLLTISALAERNCALIAEDRGWALDVDARSAPPPKTEERAVGIEFTEKMTGFFSLHVQDVFKAGRDRGREDGSSFEFTLTVTAEDLDALLEEPEHQGTLAGTAVAPALSREPLMAQHGVFQLFVDDSETGGVRKMRYSMPMRSVEGEDYFFDGFKVVPTTGSMARVWADTSTLYITIHQGTSGDGPVLGKGILRIELADFARQMTTLKVLGAGNVAQRLEAQARFGRFFAGTLADHYGGVFRRTSELEPEPKARSKRQLDVPSPELHFTETSDGTEILLTRFAAGSRGPVILAPGFGMPARSFLLDTVDLNLVEMLAAAGYDTWLLDYRASTDLPSATTQFTLDDIAHQDWPAAVAKVREVSGAETVQVLGHCMGSLTLLMALLAGLEGVRHALCSQVTLHPMPPLLTKVKAETRLGDLLPKAGIDILDTTFDAGSWRERLFDQAMMLYPTKEACRSAVCRRILFQYGEVYKHEQLNDATHEALHEFFGPANLTALSHITGAMRAGHIVDAKGLDAYMPHLDRLALPITFLQGEENRMFLPEGSEKTLELLKEANGEQWVRRITFPGYAHLDCFFGKNAARDVFPKILEELERLD